MRKESDVEKNEFAKKMVKASMGDPRYYRYDYEIRDDGSITIKTKHYLSECTPLGDGKRFRFKAWFIPDEKELPKRLSISRIMRV